MEKDMSHEKFSETDSTTDAKKAYYLKRAHNDFDYNFTAFTSAARGVAVMNGGAAIALLAFLSRIATTKEVPILVTAPNLLQNCVIAIGVFSLGVILSGIAPILMGRSKHDWGKRNLALSEMLAPLNEQDKKKLEKLSREGSGMTSLAYYTLFCGCLCFASGIIYSLLNFI
jgi:hypothetical protein